MGSSQSQQVDRIVLESGDDGEATVRKISLSEEEVNALNTTSSEGVAYNIDPELIRAIASDLGIEVIEEGQQQEEETFEEVLDEMGLYVEPVVIPGMATNEDLTATNFIDYPPNPWQADVENAIEEPVVQNVVMEVSELAQPGNLPEQRFEEADPLPDVCPFEMPEAPLLLPPVIIQAPVILAPPALEPSKDTSCQFSFPDEPVEQPKPDSQTEQPSGLGHILHKAFEPFFGGTKEESATATVAAQDEPPPREKLADSLFGEFKKQEVEKIIMTAKLEGAQAQAKLDADVMSATLNSERARWRANFTVIEQNLQKRKKDILSAHDEGSALVAAKFNLPVTKDACKSSVTKIIDCYSTHPDQVLRCKDLADSFDSCVSRALTTR